MRWWLVGVLAIAACPARPESHEPVTTPPAGDVPALVVTTPERGTFAGGGTVVVGGRARGRVTVNGVAAVVGSDGAFSVELALPRGLAIIDTHAIDAGHDTRDVRAVLVGPFATSDGSTRAPFGVRLGREALGAISKTLAAKAKAIDFAAEVKALNPVYQKGGCLGVKVDIANLTVGKIDVALVPMDDVLETNVSVDDIAVRLDVHYQVACLGGTATVNVRTKARARGDLSVLIAFGRITTALKPVLALDDLQLDLGGLPRPIETILRSQIRSRLERVIAETLERKVPPIVDAKLADLAGGQDVASVLGHRLRIDFLTRSIKFAPSGVVATGELGFLVASGERGRYVSRPPGVAPNGPGVWIAADALNQLFAGLWAARAFERTVDRDSVGPLSLLLDGSVRTIDLAIALPPTVGADQTVELAIGDLMITMRDAAGGEVQRFAVSLRSTMSVKPDGLVLTTGEPVVYAQLIAQSPKVGRPLDAAGVEGIVKGAWALVDNMIGDALAHAPIPGIAGLETRSLVARDGLIVLDVAAKK